MRTLFLLSPLLLSVVFVQLGVGVLAPLDALNAVAEGFSKREIGLIGSAHFAGFFIGCLATPALIARTGHSRAFAAVAAVGVICTLLHPIFLDPYVWMLLRVGAGFAVAGGYTVVESWLQARTTNENRGRVLSGYRMVDLIGAIGSQLLIIWLTPLGYLAYNLVAMLAVLSLLPLTLTTAAPPPQPKRPRLRPLSAIAISPLATAGVVAVGLTNASFRMIGPIYGQEFQLSETALAFFLAAAMLGGAVAQPFVGWIADKLDRRHVLIGISAAALLVCGVLGADLIAINAESLVVAAFLFGFAAFPLYSVSAAHANDFCPRDVIVELNASLIFFFAVGAVLGPIAAAELIDRFGPSALWLFIATVHVALILFGIYRMTRRPTEKARTPYRYLPRTTLILGRLFGGRSDAGDGAKSAGGAATGEMSNAAPAKDAASGLATAPPAGSDR